MSSIKKPAPLKPDLAWIRARRELLKQVKAEVSDRLGPEPEDLALYRKRYERELKGSWRLSSKAELLSEIERSDIVYGGDFHALGQAQRTHLKILRSFPGDRKVILALECFGRGSQKWLDLFLSGAIGLEELKRRAKWGRSWGFPWENYRPLLEIAKRRGFQLLALNEAPGSRFHGDLQVRERNAALVIREAYLHNPGALVYVIFGDLHLARPHLPRLVKEGLKTSRNLRDIIVHLNSEKIYFELARKGLELTTDIIRFSQKDESLQQQNRFCIMSSPPWVQWQSYLLFLERNDDSDLDRGNESEEEEFEPTDQIAGLIRLAARDLGVKFKLDDLSVYSPDDNQVWQSLEKGLKRSEREVARKLLASGRSFFIPASGRGYLARSTVNHAASLAGQYIHAKLSSRRRLLWNMPQDFSALIWTEASSYFISKLINHKRQSETFNDLRAQIALAGPADQGREAMKLALDRFMTELIWVKQGRKRGYQVRPRRKASYFEAARILGGMMGERLYMALRSRKLKEREIVQLLSRDVTHKNFARDYEDILRSLGDIGGAGVESRRERL
jgi:hypothetical protein